MQVENALKDKSPPGPVKSTSTITQKESPSLLPKTSQNKSPSGPVGRECKTACQMVQGIRAGVGSSARGSEGAESSAKPPLESSARGPAGTEGSAKPPLESSARGSAGAESSAKPPLESSDRGSSPLCTQPKHTTKASTGAQLGKAAAQAPL
eukprot:1162066-Pelagomonas_calceolata.AAC.10